VAICVLTLALARVNYLESEKEAAKIKSLTVSTATVNQVVVDSQSLLKQASALLARQEDTLAEATQKLAAQEKLLDQQKVDLEEARLMLVAEQDMLAKQQEELNRTTEELRVQRQQLKSTGGLVASSFLMQVKLFLAGQLGELRQHNVKQMLGGLELSVRNTQMSLENLYFQSLHSGADIDVIEGLFQRDLDAFVDGLDAIIKTFRETSSGDNEKEYVDDLAQTLAELKRERQLLSESRFNAITLRAKINLYRQHLNQFEWGLKATVSEREVATLREAAPDLQKRLDELMKSP